MDITPTPLHHSRSYATKAGLEKALVNLQFTDQRRVIVRNEAGRWTCIFIGMHPTRGIAPAQEGFLMVG